MLNDSIGRHFFGNILDFLQVSGCSISIVTIDPKRVVRSFMVT